MPEENCNIMKSKKTNDFKAVDFMRKRREELSDMYNSNPDEFKKQLKQIQKKYQNKFQVTKKHNAK